jgi:hypothetical protein
MMEAKVCKVSNEDGIIHDALRMHITDAWLQLVHLILLMSCLDSNNNKNNSTILILFLK